MNASLCLVPREPERVLSGSSPEERKLELTRLVATIAAFLGRSGLLLAEPFSRSEAVTVFPVKEMEVLARTDLPKIHKITAVVSLRTEFLDLHLVDEEGDPVRSPLLIDLDIEANPVKEDFFKELGDALGIDLRPVYLIY